MKSIEINDKCVFSCRESEFKFEIFTININKNKGLEFGNWEGKHGTRKTEKGIEKVEVANRN